MQWALYRDALTSFGIRKQRVTQNMWVLHVEEKFVPVGFYCTKSDRSRQPIHLKFVTSSSCLCQNPERNYYSSIVLRRGQLIWVAPLEILLVNLLNSNAVLKFTTEPDWQEQSCTLCFSRRTILWCRMNTGLLVIDGHWSLFTSGSLQKRL